MGNIPCFTSIKQCFESINIQSECMSSCCIKNTDVANTKTHHHHHQKHKHHHDRNHDDKEKEEK